MNAYKTAVLNLNKYFKVVNQRTRTYIATQTTPTLVKPLKSTNFNASRSYASANRHGGSQQKHIIGYSMLGAVLFGTIATTHQIILFNSEQASKQLAAASSSATNTTVESSSSSPSSSSMSSSDESSSTITATGGDDDGEVTVTTVDSTSSEEDNQASPSTSNQQEEEEAESRGNKGSNEQAEVVVDENESLPAQPTHAQYLIIGGGTSAMAAFKSIRANDPLARVLVVTDEKYNPYMRPPLSKDFWLTKDQDLIKELKFKQWNDNVRSVFYLEDEFYVDPKFLNKEQNGGVAVLKERQVVDIDARKKLVRLNDGWEISYDKCLLATGGKPKNIPQLDKLLEDDRVILFRNIDDFKKLHELSRNGKTITVIGGGFLGSELACALAESNKNAGNNGKVVQIFPESGNLGRILPNYLSKWTTNKVKEEGVQVIPNTIVTDAKIDDDKLVLFVEDKNGPKGNRKWLVTDHAVVAVGIEPNTDLARSGGLEVSREFGGYVVNSELQARDSIWVAGDAACFYDIQLGRRRVEHHDHAVVSGRLAGENMTGAAKPYEHQSMFWSDVGTKIGFEAIGVVDSSLNTMGIFVSSASTPVQSPAVTSNKQNENDLEDYTLIQRDVSVANEDGGDKYDKGLILYFNQQKNNQLVGILMWNLFQRMPIARKVLASQPHISNYEDIAKLFKLNHIQTDKDEEK